MRAIDGTVTLVVSSVFPPSCCAQLTLATDLKPILNLTFLDYRSIADSVERFDPGPWTTHFDMSPDPEPEDPATRLKGMAEVVRNEDSYKTNPELHELPDDLMVLLWAFTLAGQVLSE